MRASHFVIVLTTALLLSGCTDGGDDEDVPGTTTTTGTTTAPPGENETVPLELDDFGANGTSGEAPLTVTFRLEATGGDAATWRISFGDGGDAEGNVSELPQDVEHIYEVGGNFTAFAELEDGDQTVRSENVTVQVTIPPAGETPPLVFEFGPAAGCSWDLAGTPCVSEAAGTDAPSVDGFWQALDERYWGMPFSSTITRGGETGSDAGSWPLFDSDCFFYAEDTTTRIGDGNNGGGACGSADGVPEGALWIFIAPYGLPADGMVLTFGTPPAAE